MYTLIYAYISICIDKYIYAYILLISICISYVNTDFYKTGIRLLYGYIVCALGHTHKHIHARRYAHIAEIQFF